MKDKKKEKHVEQPNVDPSRGVTEENYNEFWEEKKEECEEEKKHHRDKDNEKGL